MKFPISITILLCRFARFLLRRLGRGGTNVPGTLALKLRPDILKTLSKDVTIVLVTGTNGKTTITRMIEQCFREAGFSYFTNRSGANMDTGIAAEFVVNSTVRGKCQYPYALIECDELAFRKVSRYANVKYVVVSNIFRDQLDRYGEITHTLTGIFDGIHNIPDATVCLNADCSLSTSLHERLPNKVIFYGLNCPLYKDRVKEVSDAPYCIHCGKAYRYDYVTYGHLGKYFCENCGYRRPEPAVAVEEILSMDADSTTVRLKFPDGEHKVKINLPGGYNVYNAAAAAAVGTAMGLSDETVTAALEHFECGFGRMEKVTINDTDVRMILVKNPAGANQVLSFLYNIEDPAVFVVGLNDRYADGTDISWIWDADFEKLVSMGDRLHRVVVTGIRADEMAMRFKYAGLDPQKIDIIRDYSELLRSVTKEHIPVFIMPTYTAMLSIRELMSREYHIKEFWK